MRAYSTIVLPPGGKNTTKSSSSSSDNSKRHLITLTLISIFLLLSSILSFLYTNFFSSSRNPRINVFYQSSPPPPPRTHHKNLGQCNVFSGNWIYDAEMSSYYSNETKSCVIDDRQNCMKFGRNDTQFLRWRWKPHDCDLPLFDGGKFLEIVKGKSMAFVGDSLARNQMQSLVCMLATVKYPLSLSLH